jgi:hypothetical protein
VRLRNATAIGRASRQLSGTRYGALFSEAGRAEADWPRPVEMFTVTLPVPFADTDSLVGLKLQDEFAGNEPHKNVNVPADPLMGTRVSM